ncbi:hypothetical protein D3C87_1049040 [compost metagenome]
MAKIIDFSHISKSRKVDHITGGKPTNYGKNLIIKIYYNHYRFDSFAHEGIAHISFEDSSNKPS